MLKETAMVKIMTKWQVDFELITIKKMNNTIADFSVGGRAKPNT